MTPRTALALLALAGLTVAACGSDDSGTAPDPVDASGSTPTVEELDGREFVSTAVDGYDLVEGSEINIIFLADSMVVNAGCNGMNGGFQLGEGNLTAGPFASTMMACDQALMDQDTWVAEFLESLPTIALAGSTLTIAGTDAAITLDEVEPSALEDTMWKVTGVVANEALSGVDPDSTASIMIAPDGTVAVDTGCNTGQGAVQVGASTLTFEPFPITLMACPDEQAALEASMLAVLSGEVSYEIASDTLSIRSGEGADEIGLDFTAAP